MTLESPNAGDSFFGSIHMNHMVELDVFACPLEGIALVEASAGTGKTWNICGLYLRQLLEKDLPVSRLLVVTFTRAATAELSARIRAHILAALRSLEGTTVGEDLLIASLLAAARSAGVDEQEMTRRLRDALASFDEAAIFTIHGFCQRSLAEASFSAGLPQAFEVSEDDSSLRLEVTRDFWRRELADIGTALADYLLDCGDSPERWAEWLGQAQARPLAQARWDEETIAHEEASPSLLAACEEVDSAYSRACRLWEDGKAPRQAIADALGGLNKNSYNAKSIETASGQWSAWLAMNEARCKAGQDDKRHLFAAATLAAKTNKGHTPPTHPFFEAAQSLLDARGQLDAKLEMARRRLLRRFIETAGAGLRARKQSERHISFDDILWNAHEALTRRPWLAAALHARYPVALIDEFQDTDPLQLAIFQSIYANENRHGNLFLVGDPKQAIYSFRGADLHTYLGARELADTQYTLGVNRRSTPKLVAACNQLFSANPHVFMKEGLNFWRVKAQEPSQTLEDCSGAGAALWLWRIPGEGNERLLRKEAIDCAAAASAAEIARLLAAGRRGEIKIGARALVPADIAVLVRSHKQGSLMRAALADRGVGSVELSQHSVFASFEAEELERVLAAMADPMRERLLKTALATVLMGWDASALANLAEDDDELVRQFERFNDWHEDWLRRGFAFMLWRWMAGSQVAARLLALEDGERRLTNLLHLAELLQREAGRDSPAGALRALARRRAESSGGDEALLRLESDRNLVRIVTIHRAKGLQYGIVFCPFLFNGQPFENRTGPMRLWHDEAGRQVADWRRAPEDADALKERLANERDAETLRLIYVALTRAVHRCVLVVGCYGKPGKNVSMKESTRSLLNWMLAGAGQDAAQWRKSELAPDDIDSRWRSLARDSEGAIALEDLPSGEGEPLAWGEESPTFSALRPPVVPEGWRIGSYSSLISGATHEEAARDHDAHAEQPIVEPVGIPAALPAEPVPEDDFLRFPRGAAAGDCVHAILESIDFTRPETHSAAIARALAAHPLRTTEAAPLSRMLSNMLADVLATPLFGGDGACLRLETIPLSRRLSEFSFYLPSPRLEVGKLDGWLGAHGYGGPRLAARDLTGYLKGYIDLVFEHEGRYWVLDWKTNYLGDTPSAYGPAALEAAMKQHGYHLQHLLYTVALHRHLRHTLPDYDYARHVGGTFYLFVRGVRPGWRAGGVPAGVFHHCAPKAVIESLDALLAGNRTETGKEEKR